MAKVTLYITAFKIRITESIKTVGRSNDVLIILRWFELTQV